MKIIIVYKDSQKKELEISCESDNKVILVKDKISKQLGILTSCIILKYGEVIMDDDKYLSHCDMMHDDKVILLLDVFVQRMFKSDGSQNSNAVKMIMDYGDSLGDVRKKYQSTTKVDNVILIHKKICHDEDLLKYTDCTFIVYHPITVTVINENGSTNSIKVYENVTIKALREELLKRKLLHDRKDILMMGNNILDENRELFSLSKFDALTVFIGFVIFVEYGGKIVNEYCVNFGTRISRLKTLLSRKFGDREDTLSLSREMVDVNDGWMSADYWKKKFGGRTDLEDQRTVGEYKIQRGETLKLVKRRSAEDEYVSLNIDDCTHCPPSKNERASISVNKHRSIDNLRTDISRQLSMGLCSVDIYHGEVVLEHGSIDTYGIVNGDTLTLRAKKHRRNVGTQFVVTVRNTTASTRGESQQRYLIDEMDTVRTFKMVLREQYNVNVDDIRLLWDGEEWGDDDVIREKAGEGDCSVTMTLCTQSSLEVQLVRLWIKNDLSVTVGGNNGGNVGNDGNNGGSNGGDSNVGNVSNKDVFDGNNDVGNDDGNNDVSNVGGNNGANVGNDGNNGGDSNDGNVSNKDGFDGNNDDGNDGGNSDVSNGGSNNNVGNDGNNGGNSDVSNGGGNNDGLVKIIVYDNEKVDYLRTRIMETLRTEWKHFVLSVNGQILNNDNMLRTYGIKDNDVVLLSRSLLVRYFVAGDAASAKVHRYPLVHGDTVMVLKERIKRKLNIDIRHINLSFNGDSLEDSSVLEQVGVDNDSYVLMIASLAGG